MRTPLGELLIDVQRLAILREVARAGSFAGATTNLLMLSKLGSSPAVTSPMLV